MLNSLLTLKFKNETFGYLQTSEGGGKGLKINAFKTMLMKPW